MGAGLVDSSQNIKNKAVFDKLSAGDTVWVMVRGYKPEGEIYRVLFFVSGVDKSDIRTRGGIYGVYEEELDRDPVRFIRLEDILALDFIAERNSYAIQVIRSLVLQRNNLKEKIAWHDAFIKKNLLIAG